MLIQPHVVKDFVDQYGLTINGVLHVGAHHCEEKATYEQWNVSNVVWIDANPEIVEYNQANGINQCYQAVLDESEHDAIFNVSNNTQSSSLLTFGTHSINHPEIIVTKTILVKTETLPTFFYRTGLDPADYNYWNLHIQGSEFQALKSGIEFLSTVDIIYTKVNTEEVYKGCGLLHDIVNLLAHHGFKMVRVVMTDANWGDALFLKIHKQPTSTVNFTLAIPTLDRYDKFLKNTVPKYLEMSVVNQILLGDETGEDTRKIKATEWGNHNKLDFIVNKERLGAYHNKLNLLRNSKNDWIALIDSDNEVVSEYFTALKIYWKEHGIDTKSVYLPAEIIQTYEHTTETNRPTHMFENITVNRDNWNWFLDYHYMVDYALNDGNCVFHKCVGDDLPICLPKDQLIECKLMCKILVEKGYTLHFVPNMKYYHYTHEDSLFNQNRLSMIEYNLSINWKL